MGQWQQSVEAYLDEIGPLDALDAVLAVMARSMATQLDRMPPIPCDWTLTQGVPLSEAVDRLTRHVEATAMLAYPEVYAAHIAVTQRLGLGLKQAREEAMADNYTPEAAAAAAEKYNTDLDAALADVEAVGEMIEALDEEGAFDSTIERLTGDSGAEGADR
jgi:hypothetical protein